MAPAFAVPLRIEHRITATHPAKLSPRKMGPTINLQTLRTTPGN